MTEPRTTLEQLLDLSVRFNGILFPPQTVESALSRYANSLVVLNDDEQFPISLAASATAVHYRGKYLLICTRHQLKDLDAERVGLFLPGNNTVVSSAGVRHFTHVNEFEYHDLAAFDFTKPCLEIPHLKDRFFDLRAFPSDIQSDHILAFVVAGYPYEDQKYDLWESNHLGQVKRIITCELADLSFQSQDHSLLRLRPANPINVRPSGLSGGSAFVVQLENDVPTAYFAGIVVRAGANAVSIVRAGFIQRFLDEFVDERTDG